ncbi:hypothetical protein YTPLAS18_21700 [Nitrospira sp.]|nr:hypothetical protein YTPLAS18_21700 [Nitrospira sp.]
MGKHVRVVIQLPMELKEQLDRLKQKGYTASGFIRAMLEREFARETQSETSEGAGTPAKGSKAMGM